MAANGYAWWVRRIRHLCGIYDVLRIDHFRGFAGYYAIPYGDKTAETAAGALGRAMPSLLPSKKSWAAPALLLRTWAF